jgi:hypothetical protein
MAGPVQFPLAQVRTALNFIGPVSAREETDQGKIANSRGDRRIQFTRRGPVREHEIGRLKRFEAVSSEPEPEHPLLSFVAGTTSSGPEPTDSLKEAGLRKSHENTSDYALDTMTARFFAVQRKL